MKNIASKDIHTKLGFDTPFFLEVSWKLAQFMWLVRQDSRGGSACIWMLTFRQSNDPKTNWFYDFDLVKIFDSLAANDEIRRQVLTNGCLGRRGGGGAPFLNNWPCYFILYVFLAFFLFFASKLGLSLARTANLIRKESTLGMQNVTRNMYELFRSRKTRLKFHSNWNNL